VIEWAGVRSDDLNIVIEHYPKPMIPERQQTVQSVSGRNGDIIIPNKAFKNYNQPYSVFLDAKYRGGIEAVFPRLVDWLMGNEGYQRLEDSYFPEVYRMAYYSGGVDFLNYFNEYGQGTLTFNCMPQKFYKSGERELSVESGDTLVNPSSFVAQPLIRFKIKNMAMTATLQFGDNPAVQFNINNLPVNTEIEIDVAKHRTIRRDTMTDIYLDTTNVYPVNSTWHKLSLNSSGHLIKTEIDPSDPNISEPVDYKLVDGRLVAVASTYNSAVQGRYEDLVLRKETMISTPTPNVVKDIRIVPRWWTI